jgi:hypothetical protein
MHLKDTGAIVDDRHRQALVAYSWNFSHGYLRHVAHCPHIGRAKHMFSMHQKVWELEFGLPIPKNIDHINGNRIDNRVENLRAATPSLQSANQRPRDRPLPRGAFVSKGKYICSSIRHSGKTHQLGTFESVEEAGRAGAEANAAVVEYEAAVARGENPPEPVIKVTTRPPARPRVDRQVVLELRLQGLSKAEIARSLGICRRTVSTCLKEQGDFSTDRMGRPKRNLRAVLGPLLRPG